MISPTSDIDASDFVSTSSGAADSGKVPKLNASGVLPQAFVGAPTIQTASGATLSITTTATQTVLVFAKGGISSGSTGDNATVSLKYNSVTKDSTNVLQMPAISSKKGGWALMYTEVPGAGTHDITVTTDAASLTDVRIIAVIFG